MFGTEAGLVMLIFTSDDVERLLFSLRPSDEHILRMRYGLYSEEHKACDHYRAHTLREMGAYFHVTASAIHARLKKINTDAFFLDLIKKALADWIN
jgi:DNA-directed RNA polymerase sigma subunit (sigma70/sigma32)